MNGRLAFASAAAGWAYGLATKEAVTDQLGLLGQSTDPALATTAVTMTAGQVFLFKFRAWGTSISKVLVDVSTAVVGATAAFVSIYKADGTQNTDMASCTVDGKAALGATGIQAVNLTNAVALTLGADYYVAVLVTGAPSTALQVFALPAGVGGSNGNLTAAQGFRGGTSGAGLVAMPASVTLATMAAQRIVWAGVQ